jgi:protein gp37
MRLVSDLLDWPLHRRKPLRIFVNSMSDLFHENLAEERIRRVLGYAAAAAILRGHTLHVLTKRAERMRELLTTPGFWDPIAHEAASLVEMYGPSSSRDGRKHFEVLKVVSSGVIPGLWLGVSVEDRKFGLPRIEELRATPAAGRALSIEPLLEDLGELDLAGIHWVKVGGESGADARPMKPEWARSIRDQCLAADVPFFFKQWGEWSPDGGRVGKKNSGAMLDGREWNEFPATR